MKKLNGYWLFRVVMKWLILVSFFIIASAEGRAYWLAGVMVILTLAYYILQWEQIGEKKYDYK